MTYRRDLCLAGVGLEIESRCLERVLRALREHPERNPAVVIYPGVFQALHDGVLRRSHGKSLLVLPPTQTAFQAVIDLAKYYGMTETGPLMESGKALADAAEKAGTKAGVFRRASMRNWKRGKTLYMDENGESILSAEVNGCWAVMPDPYKPSAHCLVHRRTGMAAVCGVGAQDAKAMAVALDASEYPWSLLADKSGNDLRSQEWSEAQRFGQRLFEQFDETPRAAASKWYGMDEPPKASNPPRPPRPVLMFRNRD